MSKSMAFLSFLSALLMPFISTALAVGVVRWCEWLVQSDAAPEAPWIAALIGLSVGVIVAYAIVAATIVTLQLGEES